MEFFRYIVNVKTYLIEIVNSKLESKELSVTEKQTAYVSPSGNIGMLQRKIWKEMCTAKTALWFQNSG